MLNRLLLVLIAVTLTACPRGESKTLDEVLRASQDRYAEASQDAGSIKVSNVLNQTTGHLEKLLAGEADQQALMYETANLLSQLNENAGYTSRQAIAELVSQYRELGHIGQAESDQVELIVSRTYSTLASELETTKFGLG